MSELWWVDGWVGRWVIGLLGYWGIGYWVDEALTLLTLVTLVTLVTFFLLL